MRILLLGHAPAVHVQRWASALAARGHEIRLLSVASAPGAAWPGRRVGLGLPVAALRVASARQAVRRELARFRPDVTVAHFLPNYGFLAVLAQARPLVLACWGSDLLINPFRTPFHRARAAFVLRRADLIHVDAAMLGDAAIRLGAPPSSVWVRPWGVDVDALAPRRPWAERRAEAAMARILWTRMLHPIYDPAAFLRALAILRDRGVPFRATIAGDGPLRPALEAEAKRLGVDGAVRFAGFVAEDALRSLYRDHEIYVSMSRSDSTSQSLLEAMAAGLLPIVSDIAGNREWVTHRREGILVPPGDGEAVAAAVAEALSARAGEGNDPLADAAAMTLRAREEAVRRARFSDTVTALEGKMRGLGSAR
ncbi:MAG TPA: glycosyltransferase family 4 protein [Candidatus Eisenbacteria bacterium]